MEKDIRTYRRRRRLSTTTDEPLVNNHSPLPPKIAESNSSTEVIQASEHAKKSENICTGENSRGGILEEESQPPSHKAQTDTLCSVLVQEKISSALKVYTRRSKLKRNKVDDIDTPSIIVQRQGDVGNNHQSTSLVPTGDLGDKQSQTSLHLLSCTDASCDLELQPLDLCSREHNHRGTSNVQVSVGSACEKNKAVLLNQESKCSSQVSAASKRRKNLAGPLAPLSSISLKINPNQFSEESSSNDVIPLSDTSRSLVVYTASRSNKFNPATVQQLPKSLYEPRRLHYYPLQSSSHLLTRDRSGWTNRHGTSEFGATMWSEDELYGLWVGVRRYGIGNWDLMLRDRTLNFMPWRRAHQLAQLWEEEQSNRHFRNQVSENYLPNAASFGPVIAPSTGLLRLHWPNESVHEVSGTTQQQHQLMSCNTGSFTSLLRQVEQNALVALSANQQLANGRTNTDKGL